MDLNSLIVDCKPDLLRSWSPYQQAIFDAIDADDNLIVEAVAGSGKTTTMVEAIIRMRDRNASAAILAVAFNKTIAATIAARVPTGVDAKTFHALCLSTFASRPQVEGRKVYRLLKDALPGAIFDEVSYPCSRLISMAKNLGLAEVDHDTFAELCNDYEIFIPEDFFHQAIAACVTVYSLSLSDRKTIDFDDMLLMPFIYQHGFPQYDCIFIDEAQDLSPLQHALLAQMNASRYIAFGDSRQAIYGFRGADTSSMENLRRSFAMRALPLSISYRCPRAVVLEAQRIVPHIEYSETAAEGTVAYDDIHIQNLTRDAMVICRNNAPLFRLGLQFIKAKLPVTVRTNFGPALNAFIKSFKTKDIHVFKMRLEDWYSAESTRLVDSGQTSKLGVVTDKYSACLALADASESVEHMQRILAQLLSENSAAPVLSTIHKAKGEEAKHVYIYGPELIPSRFAKSDAALRQEYNLLYVAITRSLDTLTYVNIGD